MRRTVLFDDGQSFKVGEPIEEAVERIAQRAALALVQRTQTWQPLDPNKTGIVVSAIIAAFLETFAGTLRVTFANARREAACD